MTDIIKIPTALLWFLTMASSGDSNNIRQPEMAAETGKPEILISLKL